MMAVVFQVLNESKPISPGGFPGWVFWFMLIVIAILIIFILVRDKGVREKIKGLFSWFFHKIRVARLKSRINRINQQKTDLIIELGRTVWEKNIELNGMDHEKQEIEKLKLDEDTMQREIGQLDKEIDKLKTEADGVDKTHQAKVTEEEEKKKPLDKRYRELKKAYESLQGQVKEREKSKSKLTKIIQQHHQEIEKIKSDEYLSKIEKESKRKAHEKEVDDLQKQDKQAEVDIGSLKKKGENLYQEMEKLKKEINGYAEAIERLQTENHSFHKNNDESVEKLQKSRKALGIKKIGIQKQLSLAFEKVGEKANQSRIENAELNRLFAEIDTLEKQIREFESRMKKT